MTCGPCQEQAKQQEAQQQQAKESPGAPRAEK